MMFDWDDVRFILGMTIMGFLFPFAMISGFITANYVLCDKMNVCGSVEVKK